MISPNQPRPLNILLAFDGSKHAFAAIDLLINLPLPTDSTITILGVLIPRESSNHSFLESSIDQAKAILDVKGFKIIPELIIGYPAEIVVQIAEARNPDLIVVGSKGLRATLGILLGGVAQQIVEYANQPVLVVRAPRKTLKRILLVIDESIYSQNALNYLAGGIPGVADKGCRRFPLPDDCDVRVMHVLPPIPSPERMIQAWPIGTEMIPPIPSLEQMETGWLKEEEENGQKLLDRAVNYLNQCPGITASGVLIRGDAAEKIIEYTEENAVDLIIAGSRGLSQIGSWFLGSVSRKLVHYAGCSVLIVKTPSQTSPA
jgi:nucleotide-binding universal stress UspA family protein